MFEFIHLNVATKLLFGVVTVSTTPLTTMNVQNNKKKTKILVRSPIQHREMQMTYSVATFIYEFHMIFKFIKYIFAKGMDPIL